ncbi:MAG: YcxB family protein [Lachnospiraceae bacterium]
MKKEFDVKMSRNDVFAFLLRQQCTGMRGLLNLVINVVVILCLVLNWANYDLTAKLLLFFILILFDVYTPVALFRRAVAQAKKAMSMHYIVTEAGITVVRDNESVELLWGHLLRFTATGKRIYIYTSRITAFIFPKEQLGEETFEFVVKQLKKNKKDLGTRALDTAKCVAPDEDTDKAAKS